MNATSTLRPSARSPRSVEGPSAMMSPLSHAVADAHQRLLVDAGRLVRALELHQPVDVDAGLGRHRVSSVARMTIRVASIWSTMPVRRAAIAAPESRATIASMPVPTSGASALHQRHRLALHVRAHQRAVGVVVLEERDQRRGDRDELLRRHVHEVDAVARHHHDVAGMAADDQVLGQRAVRRRSARWPARRSTCASSIADR